MSIRLAIFSGVCFALFGGGPAHAQDAYPSRPITMVVAFPPGGVADKNARPTAAALEKRCSSSR